MNIANLPEDSESSDEDYIPEKANVELPSEEESDGDVEEDSTLVEDVGRRGTKRQKNLGKSKKKRKNIQDSATNEGPPKTAKFNEEQKQQTASLWADFMKDTGFKTRAERSQPSNQTSNLEANFIVKPNESKSDKVEPKKKVKVTEVYNFAGEEVMIEKELTADSVDARLNNMASSSDSSSRKPVPGGRINSILNNLGKKRKINTLEKSKLDWEKFKKDEDITDELQAYSKSKDGYLEKQDFLQRADLRRFEIEKGIRNTLRKNQMNNVNM